jgi:hypothetical protein
VYYTAIKCFASARTCKMAFSSLVIQITIITYRGVNRVLIIVLEPLPVAEMRVEASVRGRVLLSEKSQVPLAYRVSGVAVSLQVLREESLIQW